MRPALFCASLFLSLLLSNVRADEIRGTVTDSDARPVAGARVTLVETNRSVLSAADGSFSFTDLQSGDYHLRALRSGLGSAVAELSLAGIAEVVLKLNISLHREKIVVSSSRSGIGTHESVHPVSVMEKDELLANMKGTVADIVAAQPGISSSSFGAGASRPVIRGHQASRVRVLEGGLDSGDASATSPDHAVSADPFDAERIEVLRGPAVLLYGSSATGGVVNVIDERVPVYVPGKRLTGELNLRGATGLDEGAGSLNLKGGGGEFAWQLHGFSRETDDYEIPGPAIRNNPASDTGTLANSFTETDGGSVGASWISDRGHLGLAYKQFNSLYGIPAREFPPDEDVSIDLEQRRYDLRAGWKGADGFVRSVDLSVGATDYEHVELEDSSVGTRLTNESVDGRLELQYGRGNAQGVGGLQIQSRNFEAIGDEAFVPPSTTDSIALFVLQELTRGPVRWEFGARWEEQQTEALSTSNTDSGVSGSVGVAWSFAEDWSFSGALSRSARFPSAEELYSDGPHLATQSFEIGDVDLGVETGVGFDAGVRRTGGRWTGELNLFVQDFDDYITEQPDGTFQDGLPVFRFFQEDAEFYGYELSVLFGLIHSDSNDLDLRLTTDSVRARLDDGRQIRLIPPRSHSVGLDWRRSGWSGGVDLRHAEAQDRLALGETVTPSYTTVDLHMGYMIARKGLVHQVVLRGNNLTDEEIRIHASRLKDTSLQPGRNVSLSYRLVF